MVWSMRRDDQESCVAQIAKILPELMRRFQYEAFGLRRQCGNIGLRSKHRHFFLSEGKPA